MGEVYRARDTRLDREVAVKVLPDALANDPDRLKRFEREARATAALTHPNVLTLLDVGHADGRAYVIFELLEGETLGDRLQRGPLPLGSAVECVVQVSRGLSAAHSKGIVHRDIKPENVFLSATGVVKILDFGLVRVDGGRREGARETTGTDETGPGVRLGTVSYMSPEQAKGLPADARADIFSLGTVFFEMVSGRHPFRRDSAAETVTAILRDDPPQLGVIAIPPAVERVMRRCLEKQPEDRFQSMHDLGLALEAVWGRDTEADAAEEEVRPYPGLSSFTEADAAHFFGREAEVAALWEKIRRQTLLAVIGPSGAGKTSFLRAGVIAHRPSGWVAVVCTPGARPFVALGQALTPKLDAETMAELIRGVSDLAQGEEPDRLVAAIARWRRRHTDVLLVVDQFEELFTLNPAEIQARFARLLGRLVEESGLRVLLGVRDDFFMRCGEHPALATVFQDVTPLLSPSPEGLERALREPAARQGVRFEDEALVEEMTAAVSAERGALPLLAFAVSRLWEERDRERRLLTREAYERIGGMGGALAQHAEATLKRLGTEREGIVRELFRNLVTPEGTRATRGTDELLSVFGATRGEAAAVLDALVMSRLLTAYDAPERVLAGATHEKATATSHRMPSASGAQQIEIAHESLLTHWPRLVRWQTQDADGAQLRDQLRQAARLWDDRARPDELLWTGASYLDYRAWRARYPGRLSSLEEDFAQAMAAVANRRRRRRRIAVAALVAASLAVAIVTAALWRRSEAARQKADAEARRAEAGKLLTLGELELQNYPTVALAYAIRSLELSDSTVARMFAVRALQRAPVAIVAPANQESGLEAHRPAFSPNGEWFALGGYHKVQVRHRDGRPPVILGDYSNRGSVTDVAFGPRSDLLVTNLLGDIRTWSVPGWRELRRWKHDEGPTSLYIRGNGFITSTSVGATEVLRWSSLDAEEARLIGTDEAQGVQDLDPSGGWLATARGRRVFLRSLDRWNSPPRLLAEHGSEVRWVAFDPEGKRLAAADTSGDIRIWPTTGRVSQPLRILRSGDATGFIGFDPTGRWLAAHGTVSGRPTVRLWDLTAPPAAEPLVLAMNRSFLNGLTFDPTGRWLVTAEVWHAAFWPLGSPYARVFTGHEGRVESVAFTPDGRSLVSASGDGTVRIWSLAADAAEASRVVLRDSLSFPVIAVDPTSQHVVLSADGGRVLVVPLEKGPVRTLSGFSEKAMIVPVALSPDGLRVAAAPFYSPAAEHVVRAWSLETGAAQVLGPVPAVAKAKREVSRAFTSWDRTVSWWGPSPVSRCST
jgi:WD40 repeat protein